MKTTLTSKSVAGIFKKITDTDRDVVVAVSGTEGEGKSTCAIQVCRQINGDDFSVKKHVMYKHADIMKSIQHLKNCAFVIDEGMDALYKRNWAEKERKTLNKFFSMCRKQRLVILINIPNFWDLDDYYVKHRIRFWVYVVTRGHATVSAPDKNKYTKDRWNAKINEKIMARRLGGPMASNERIIGAIAKTKNFVARLTFSDLPDHIKREYLQLKDENYDEFEKREEDKKIMKDKYQSRMYLTIQRMAAEKIMTKKRIAELFGYSPRHLSQILGRNLDVGMEEINDFSKREREE